ncbi:MAG: hypothetical protein IT225_04045 [Flavobacteriales bacterium]|jgi:hypothetical protein|nr:hypothetical protein [Flavobacteriales bacterium]
MNNAFLHRCVLWILGAGLYATPVRAQQPAPIGIGEPPERITLHLAGLTSEVRDAMARELAINGEAHIAFACVPAGVIVIEGSSRMNGQQLEQRSRSILTDRSVRIQRTDLRGSIAQAEAACAQVRDR